MTDFYSSHQKYILSFKVQYLQGVMNKHSSNIIYLINDNGTQKSFYYKQYSRGSGIYFELSRRFQIYPWKGRKKK